MRAALNTLHAIGADCLDSGAFADRGVQGLQDYVRAESAQLRWIEGERSIKPLEHCVTADQFEHGVD